MEDREDDYTTGFSDTGLRKTSQETISESAQGSRRSATEISFARRGKPIEAVSQAFFDRLMKLYIEAMGPFAPVILRDQISALGESRDDFPRSRIDELIKAIEPEILDCHMIS